MDSRTIKATIDALCASPREISEAYFDVKTGKLTRLVFSPGRRAEPAKEPAQEEKPEASGRDASPRLIKPKRSAVASLKLAPPSWVEDTTKDPNETEAQENAG